MGQRYCYPDGMAGLWLHQNRLSEVGRELNIKTSSRAISTEDDTASQMLVELDARRRVALGWLGRPEHNRYLVEELPDGTLILRPAVVMTEHEAALLRHPELVGQILANQADPTQGVRSSARRPRKTGD